MARPDRTSNPICHALINGAAIHLVPLNSEAKEALDAFFSDHGDHTTVAFTQEDSGLGGYGQVNVDWKTLVITSS